MKLKALIVDDEPKLAEVLALKLRDHVPQIQVAGQARSTGEAATLIRTLEPDVVFLDVSMPGGSGFSLLESFPQPAFSVIFVTGHSEYAIDAFRVSAVDYLLKPVRTTDLIDAVKKLEERLAKRENADMDLLRHNLEHQGDQESRVAIPGSQAYEFVAVKDIVRLEGIQKYTQLYLQNGSKILSSYHIGKYKEMLTPFQFFSPHKSHLINTQHIRRYLLEGTVEMTDGSSVPVSRRKREDFLRDVLKKG